MLPTLQEAISLFLEKLTVLNKKVLELCKEAESKDIEQFIKECILLQELDRLELYYIYFALNIEEFRSKNALHL